LPVILTAAKPKSNFEVTHFDNQPAFLNFTAQAFSTALGGATSLSDEDIRNLAGAPSGSKIDMHLVTQWSDTGDDRPSPGLYLSVTHPQIIDGCNLIGLCHVPGVGYHVYIKDVFFNDYAAPGVGGLACARVVRFCLATGVREIRLLAAGGRTWPDIPNGQGKRWLGYYFWARCGFDMDLLSDDVRLGGEFRYPSTLSGCIRVSQLLQANGGVDWWKVCGTGNFMAFDSSSEKSASVYTLEAYLAQKGL
jgi:hypothetical protein